MKKLIYLLSAASFLGVEFFSINMGFMKLSIFRIILLLIFGIVTLTIIEKRKIPILNKIQNNILSFYLFFFYFGLLSIAWVYDQNAWFKAIFYLGTGLICIWTVSLYIKTKKDFNRIFLAIMLIVILQNFIGWSEIVTGNYKYADLTKIDKYDQFQTNESARLPVSTYTNPNNFSTMLVFGIYSCLLVFANYKNKFIKLICFGTITSSLLLIIKTSSRANFVGLLLGVLVYLIIRNIGKINTKKILFSIFICVGITVFSANIFESLQQIPTDFNTHSDYTRTNLIRNGLSFTVSTYFIGVGAGNIEYWMKNKSIYDVGQIVNIHNWWLELLVGYGAVVFIWYLFTYYKVFRIIFKSILRTNDEFIKNTSTLIVCWLSSFLICSVSSSTILSAEWLWFTWAIIIAYIGFVTNHLELIEHE